VGTLSSLLIFLWLTYDFHQQDRSTQRPIESAHRWWREKGLAQVQLQRLPHHSRFRRLLRAGHDEGLLPAGENNIVAIVMTGEGLQEFFPQDAQTGVTKEEAVQLVEFLKWWARSRTGTGRPRMKSLSTRTGYARPAPKRSTRQTSSWGCGGCHSLENLGGASPAISTTSPKPPVRPHYIG